MYYSLLGTMGKWKLIWQNSDLFVSDGGENDDFRGQKLKFWKWYRFDLKWFGWCFYDV